MGRSNHVWFYPLKRTPSSIPVPHSEFRWILKINWAGTGLWGVTTLSSVFLSLSLSGSFSSLSLSSDVQTYLLSAMTVCKHVGSRTWGTFPKAGLVSYLGSFSLLVKMYRSHVALFCLKDKPRGLVHYELYSSYNPVKGKFLPKSTCSRIAHAFLHLSTMNHLEWTGSRKGKSNAVSPGTEKSRVAWAIQLTARWSLQEFSLKLAWVSH